jgi:lipopolysaccharide transport system ATP-binding protein
MSSDEVALAVRGLAKAYTIRHSTTDHVTLAELALDRLRHPLRRAQREQFWALEDVSFELHRGEVLGLIGRNGAGKSTLLKVISRITDPTRGEVHVWGAVGSLLEVGTGFHGELTGRENVYLNGAILGMSRREIDRKFDAIIDFAGVEKFLDTPVKRYSSGMYVRLAFAVAAHLDSEILLLDEVLAVGDGDFQAKCLGKVSDLARSGRGVMLVSHNMSTIRQFASRAVLLDGGRLVEAGSTESVIGRYEDAGGDVVTEIDIGHVPRYDPSFGARARMSRVRLNHDQGIVRAHDDLSYTVWIDAREDLESVRVAQTIYAADGHAVGSSFGSPNLRLPSGHVSQFDVVLPSPMLAPGRYYVALGVGFGDTTSGVVDLDVVLDTVHFEVVPAVTDDGRLESWNSSWGSIRYAIPSVIDVTSEESPRSSSL